MNKMKHANPEMHSKSLTETNRAKKILEKKSSMRELKNILGEQNERGLGKTTLGYQVQPATGMICL